MTEQNLHMTIGFLVGVMDNMAFEAQELLNSDIEHGKDTELLLNKLARLEGVMSVDSASDVVPFVLKALNKND